MHLFIKTLSGAVQVLEFPGKEQVTVAELEQLLHRPGMKMTHDMDDKKEAVHEDIITVIYLPDELNDRDVERVESAFRQRLSFFDSFKQLIQDYEAVVAGGSVLCALHEMPIQDFDIYVHQSKVHAFLSNLCSLEVMTQSDYHSCPAYDESFMRRNHIMGRFHLVTRYSRYVRHRNVGPRNSFDIMVIPDHIPLKQVVTNFDLTFCQVWWDGHRLDATHVVDIRSKHGSLQSDYLSMYVDCNVFTCKRIQKYLKRGFYIHVDTSSLTIQSQIELQPTIKRNQIVHEQWMIYSVLRGMTHYIKEKTDYCRLLCLAIFHNVPIDWTWDHLVERHNTEVVCAFLHYFEDNMLAYMDSAYLARWVIPESLLNVHRTMTKDHIKTVQEQWVTRLVTTVRDQINEINDKLSKRLTESGHVNEQGGHLPRYQRLFLKRDPENPNGRNRHFFQGDLGLGLMAAGAVPDEILEVLVNPVEVEEALIAEEAVIQAWA